MEELENVEVFHIEIKEEGTFAHISFRNPNCKNDDMNNGYSHVIVPMNLRPIQLSSRDNTLVNQSVKCESVAAKGI